MKELRLERSIIGSDIGTLEHFDKLVSLELIDVELKAGFGQGFIKLRKISKLMLIPTYRDEVKIDNYVHNLTQKMVPCARCCDNNSEVWDSADDIFL